MIAFLSGLGFPTSRQVALVLSIFVLSGCVAYIRPNPALPVAKQANLKVAFLVSEAERARKADLDIGWRLAIGRSFADGLEQALEIVFREVRSVSSREQFLADPSCDLLIEQTYSGFWSNSDITGSRFAASVACGVSDRTKDVAFECQGLGNTEWHPGDATPFGTIGAINDVNYLRKESINRAIRALAMNMLAKIDSAGVAH
jgi:hypothetical protein